MPAKKGAAPVQEDHADKKKEVEETKESKSNKENHHPIASTKSDTAKPKRPASAYNLFVSSKRAEVKAQNPDLGPKDMIKHIAGLWKNASEAEKQKFKTLHEQEKAKLEAAQKAAEDPKPAKRKDASQDEEEKDTKKRKAEIGKKKTVK
ncbi:unnamed protein product [Blepharisma stoltei]|uniref:HMG box domain-containing protein n=1 Tax=Blepharisma stoltei TaxID=1481888 RepID=A0AAU9JMW4_9CILI|nr:unnamed protein product [Blepharisma stoltei]